MLLVAVLGVVLENKEEKPEKVSLNESFLGMDHHRSKVFAGLEQSVSPFGGLSDDEGWGWLMVVSGSLFEDGRSEE